MNQNGTSDLEWKKQIKVGSIITKEDFVSSLERFLLVEIKTRERIYTKMESQPSQKIEYAHWRKQKGNS